jgi:tyrosyl-tRNA synthetase
MTVIECLMKAKCVKSFDDGIHKIETGGVQMNHTKVMNPQEALIYSQHILVNNVTLIKIGKSFHFSQKFTLF